AGQKNRHVVLESRCEDRILAKKSAERRAADQRQRADKKCGERDFKISSQSAHVPDVLFVMKTDDDRAGSEEEKRFKERVSKKMKHRRLVRCQSNRHHHVTELRDR